MTLAKREKLVLIGGYPPPYGGISVHILRLSELASQRFDTHVVDLYSDGRPEDPVYVHACGARRPLNLVRALKTLLTLGVDLAHFHISAMANFAIAGPFLMFATRRAAGRVLTIHSGSFIAEYKRLPALLKRIFLTICVRFDEIVVVGQEQREYLASLGIPEARITVIPAFLPPVVKPDETTRVDFIRLRERTDQLLVISGYALAYYGFHVVLDAAERLRTEGLRPGLVFCMYNKYDPIYFAEIESRLMEFGEYLLFKDLPPEKFAYVLSSCDIYVRATDRDGDAVAIREAHALGLKVVASDCVARPEGVQTFRTMDAAALTDVLLATLGDPDQEQVVGEKKNWSAPYLALYERVLRPS